MERLNERFVRHRWGKAPPRYPERVLQFGEGNFLRGFIDWMIHRMNREGLFQGSVVAIQPTPHGKVVPKLNAQDGLYTVVLRGIQDGERVDHAEVVQAINRSINPYTDWDAVLKTAEDENIRFVFSNTTEAGITYTEEPFSADRAPLSFPGKLTALLYHRYQKWDGHPDRGWTIIPCELVDDNGQVLKKMVQRKADDWQLPLEFQAWLDRHNRFCDTLVDRIVTGYPADEIEAFRKRLGYEDQLLTVGEPYHFLCIDADDEVKESLPFHQAGLHVHWGKVLPYRERKVRLLNGAHTLLFSIGLLCGKQTVGEVMEDPRLRRLVECSLFDEILPVLDEDPDQSEMFAKSVLERFSNPYNRHLLSDIGLNAVSKYRARLLPTVLAWWEKKGDLPPITVFSLATLLYRYRPSIEMAGDIQDEPDILRFLKEAWQNVSGPGVSVETFAQTVLSNKECWGTDLSSLPGLMDRVVLHVSEVMEKGTEWAVDRLMRKAGDPVT